MYLSIILCLDECFELLEYSKLLIFGVEVVSLGCISAIVDIRDEVLMTGTNREYRYKAIEVRVDEVK